VYQSTYWITLTSLSSLRTYKLHRGVSQATCCHFFVIPRQSGRYGSHNQSPLLLRLRSGRLRFDLYGLGIAHSCSGPSGLSIAITELLKASCQSVLGSINHLEKYGCERSTAFRYGRKMEPGVILYKVEAPNVAL
jgi:hypothetical protein